MTTQAERPLYRLLPEPQPVSLLGCWEAAVTPFTQVVGYSYLGHFFLHDPSTDAFAVLYPFRQAYKSYGPFESTAEFERNLLQDSGFSQYVLRPAHQAAIALRIGVPGAEEIFIPTPYPFLGGTEAPDTYQKGNAWVFAALVGQCHGLA